MQARLDVLQRLEEEAEAANAEGHDEPAERHAFLLAPNMLFGPNPVDSALSLHPPPSPPRIFSTLNSHTSDTFPLSTLSSTFAAAIRLAGQDSQDHSHLQHIGMGRRCR